MSMKKEASPSRRMALGDRSRSVRAHTAMFHRASTPIRASPMATTTEPPYGGVPVLVCEMR